MALQLRIFVLAKNSGSIPNIHVVNSSLRGSDAYPSSFFYLDLFYVHECFAYVYMIIYNLELELWVVVNRHMGCWESNQDLLLTTKPSLKHPYAFFWPPWALCTHMVHIYTWKWKHKYTWKYKSDLHYKTTKQHKLKQAWWFIPLIPALQRQAEFESSLIYIANHRTARTT